MIPKTAADGQLPDPEPPPPKKVVLEESAFGELVSTVEQDEHGEARMEQHKREDLLAEALPVSKKTLLTGLLLGLLVLVPYAHDSLERLRTLTEGVSFFPDASDEPMGVSAVDDKVGEASLPGTTDDQQGRADELEGKGRVEARGPIAKANKPKIPLPVDEGKPVRSIALSDDDRAAIKSFNLLTSKKVLYVMNVSETDLEGTGPLAMKVRERAKIEGGGVVPVCAKIESELSELPEADRKEMLDAVGLKEPALATLTHEAYRLLGLQSYFTSGPKEIRAWTVPVGATAPQAAGVIHTDFERGFIRAEIYSIQDLVQHKSESAIKAAGKMRLEGKSYVMQEGDVCHFLFNV